MRRWLWLVFLICATAFSVWGLVRFAHPQTGPKPSVQFEPWRVYGCSAALNSDGNLWAEWPARDDGRCHTIDAYNLDRAKIVRVSNPRQVFLSDTARPWTLTLQADSQEELRGKPGQCLRHEDIHKGVLKWVDCTVKMP